MKALITAGGRGTRLRPLTHTQNKHLIPIANKPILNYAIEHVREAGITDIGIVINADETQLQKEFKDGKGLGVNITYIPQEAPLGLAHVVKISQDFIGNDPFIFYLGDNMVVGGIKRFLDAFLEKASNCHLTLAAVKDPERFGVPELVDGRVVTIEEKPERPKSNFAVSGIYFYDSTIFEAVNNIEPSARGELEISDAHQYLLDHGKTVTYSEITGWWKDTGKPNDLLEANRLVLENIESDLQGEIDEDSNVHGKVILGAGSKIVNSVVRGPVCIGPNSRIEDAYVGPYTAIGQGCGIRNSEVEYSILLDKSCILDVDVRVESSLLGLGAHIIRAERRPLTNRFMIGDQSVVELK